jgi:hypothetical protein
MSDSRLVSYIAKGLSEGKKKEDVISDLIKGGWPEKDIKEASSEVEKLLQNEIAETESKSGRIYDIKKWRNFFLLIFIPLFILSYFAKEKFKTADYISPQSLMEPEQTEADIEPFEFEKDGFVYNLTPLYSYDISGLVVHRLDYNTWYSLSRTDKLFTTDLCIIWGENLKSKAYQNKSLSVKQDFRFCLFSYGGDLVFNGREVSNNHLLVNNKEVAVVLKKVSVGDQVRIKGYLVNVEAKALDGKTEKMAEWKDMRWQTSVTREDSGGGACEIIYATSLQILKKGNEFYHGLFAVSSFVLLLVILWMIFDFVYGFIK